MGGSTGRVPPLCHRIGPPPQPPGLSGWFSQLEQHPFSGGWQRGGPHQDNPTLIEALANRESCLMCWPFLPMMAPTACAGMKTCTVSCSGGCGYSVTVQGSRSLLRSQCHHKDQGFKSIPPSDAHTHLRALG